MSGVRDQIRCKVGSPHLHWFAFPSFGGTRNKSVKNKPYEIIEHTADIGIRIKAKNLEGLFIQSARALFDIIAEIKSPVLSLFSLTKTIKINLEAENREELYLNWLNELLSLAGAKNIIFYDFKISRITDKTISAVVFGKKSSAYKVNVEVKAATYHDLSIKEINGIWQAEVILDV